MIALDLPCRRSVLRTTMAVGDGEETDQHDQQQAEPPVHEQAERQHDEQRDEGGEILAEEAEPEPAHAVRRRSA